MIWPHRQNYHAAYDVDAERSLSRLSARPTAARCRGGEHNTDAVKTTALGGVGTLLPVRTAARPMRLTEPQYSKATPATLSGASEIDADRDATALQFGKGFTARRATERMIAVRSTSSVR